MLIRPRCISSTQENFFCGVACKYTFSTGESGLSWNNKKASFELSKPQTAAESASASKHKASQGNLLASHWKYRWLSHPPSKGS